MFSRLPRAKDTYTDVTEDLYLQECYLNCCLQTFNLDNPADLTYIANAQKKLSHVLQRDSSYNYKEVYPDARYGTKNP